MTTNETIARWAEKKIIDCPLGWAIATWDEVEDWCRAKGIEYGPLIRLIGSEDGDVSLRYVMKFPHEYHGEMEHWEPDTDITLWHGEDGLLAEIKGKGLAVRFETALCDATQHASIIGLLRATPAQLAAALVEVIGETP